MPNQLVFIYGTLKRGHGNHCVISDGVFVGQAVTESRFGLYTSGIPFMTDAGLCRYGDEPTCIHGEVWQVGDDVMATLDKLEGHPSAYRRRPIGVQVNGGFITAEAYIWPHQPPIISEYERSGHYSVTFTGTPCF